MNAEEFARDFATYSNEKLEQNRAQIVRCAGLLSDAQLWSRVNANCNSVGNLLLHLTGNIRQWICSSIGGEAFERDRPREFAERGPLPRERVLSDFERVMTSASAVIAAQTTQTLAIRHKIQAYDVSRLTAILHVVEHCSYHCGQIVHMTKAILDLDLSQYDARGHRLNKQNAP